MAGLEAAQVKVTYDIKSGDVIEVKGVKITEKGGKVTIEYDDDAPTVAPTVIDKDQHVKVPKAGTYIVPKGVKVTFGETALGMVSTCLADGKEYRFSDGEDN